LFLIDRSKYANRFLKSERPNSYKSRTVGVVSTEKTYMLGQTTVYVDQGCFESPEGRVHLQPQLIDVLDVLVTNAGEVVSRDVLLEKVWSGKVVAEESLTRAISELRKALNDKAGSPKFIQTIPKKGYRLICQPMPATKKNIENSIESAHSVRSLNILYTCWAGWLY